MPVAERALFIFRRDLRLTDNRGLQAAASAREVIPLFHQDAVLMSRWGQADKRMSFLRQRLNDLDKQLKVHNSRLHVTAADSPGELVALCRRQGIGAIFQNRDFTPYARRRDAAIKSSCVEAGIDFHNIDDLTLNAPETVLKKDGTPYTVFTPYYNRAADERVDAPATTSPKNFGLCDALAQKSVDEMFGGLGQDSAGGGTDAVPVLAERLRPLADYGETRDFPAQPGTSRLSAHIRFGTFSPRQVYLAILEEHGTDHPLIRQLYWRDFYYQIAFHFPHVFTGPFRQQYRGIAWRSGDDGLDRWCEGRTGFPIIDAGMRELVQTGYMHNRVRMVVASYLTKNLGYHWKNGENFFARHLVDFDPAVNNGNWQWASSTGCDAQPYFRVFNPWRQQKKFDVEVEYIQRWVPELRTMTPKQIHGLEKDPAGYIQPQVDLKSSADAAKQRFRE